jgi:hypothetical protein
MPPPVPASDRRSRAGEADPAAARRLVGLLNAAWAAFDQIAAASPAELRKGPRGGGRDRDQLIGHVIGADTAYARKLGVKRKQPGLGDIAAIGELREAIAAVVGGPVGRLTPGGRRLDHALRGPPDRLARPRARLGDARPGGQLSGPAGAEQPGLIGEHEEPGAIPPAELDHARLSQGASTYWQRSLLAALRSMPQTC